MKEDTKTNEKAMWIFACYDRERVQAMAMFSNAAALMSEEHAISTVRGRFSIGQNEIVKLVKPQIGTPLMLRQPRPHLMSTCH